MSPRRPPPPHASVHLPSLHGPEALLLVNILERLISAIWRAHGPAMQATLEDLHAPAQPPRPEPSPANIARASLLEHHDLPF